MDGHVAKSRTEDLGLVTVRKKRSCISNEEVEDGIAEVHIQTPDILNNASSGTKGTSSNSEQNRSTNYREGEEEEEEELKVEGEVQVEEEVEVEEEVAVEEEVEVEEEYEDEEINYSAEHAIKLFVPISLCILIVVGTIRSTNFNTSKGLLFVYVPFHEESTDISTKVWHAVANSLILMVTIIIATISLIAMYKYKFYKLINTWLIISSILSLSFFSLIYSEQMLKALNIPMDLFTLGFVSWNFGVVGMICIHWQGPFRLQQAYLIFMSAVMALIFIKYLPDWTTWVVLGVISIWDLIAVLTPKGPLRILVETAQERDESLFPALVYSSVIMYTVMMTYAGYIQTTMTTSDTATSDSTTYPVRNQTDNQNNLTSGDTEEGGFTPENTDTHVDRGARPVQEVCEDTLSLTERSMQQEDSNIARESQEQDTDDTEVERGVRLGLGDFVFYSVLVGKASTYGDWNTTLACFVAILIGLCLTLLLLATLQKALPALPISITFGLTFYFATRVIVAPFADNLASGQVFI